VRGSAFLNADLELLPHGELTKVHVRVQALEVLDARARIALGVTRKNLTCAVRVGWKS
jgi:hypothetical protein